MKQHILTIILLALSLPANAQRKIYLKNNLLPRDQNNYQLVNQRDTAFIRLRYANLADGIYFPAEFELRGDVPDTTYQVYVDGVLRQEGRIKNGQYTGTTWSCALKETRITTYEDGEKQGAKQRFDSEGRLIWFRWHDKGLSPLITSWYPNGKVKEHNFYLNEALYWHVGFSDDGGLRAIRQYDATRDMVFKTNSFFPFKNGVLDGQAEWKQQDQMVHITFANNEVIDWEIYTGQEMARTLQSAYHRLGK